MNKHQLPSANNRTVLKIRFVALFSCAAACLALMALVVPAQAATVTWSTNATSTNWALGSNWVGGVAPVTGDDIVVFAGGTFSPTGVNTGITVNSLTLTNTLGNNNLNLGNRVSVGAGGVFNNMAAGSLAFNGGVELTADQIWGGTRTIFVLGNNAVTGVGKMRFDGSAIRFDTASSTWSAGLDIHTSVSTGTSGFAAGATMTPFGTGTITMINARADGVTASLPSMLIDGNSANISRATAQTLANNIALQNTGSGGTFSILTSATTGDGRFYVLSGDITGNASNRTLIFGNNTTGSANRTTVILTGNNTYTATTQVNNQATRPLTLQVGDGGTTGTLGSGNVSVTANNILAFNRSDSLTVANNISGGGELRQIGAGTTVLTGSNNYTGATTVSVGALIINGTNSGTGVLTVSQNATLGGSGRIAGDTTISGNLQPGNSPGLLTFDSSLTLDSTSVTTMEINDAGTRGSVYDAIDVGSLLTYGGTLKLTLGTTFGVGEYSFDLFDFGDSTGSFSVVELDGFYTGSLTNSGSGTWGLSTEFETWSFSQSDGVLNLSVVVPEPSTYALLVLAAVGLGAHVIRRRRLN